MNPQPEPVADAGGVVEQEIAEWFADLDRALASASERATGTTHLNGEIVSFSHVIEVARKQVGRLLPSLAKQNSLLAQVESLKAERDDLQAEAGTQALTIRRLTQEREELQDALATEREALTWLSEHQNLSVSWNGPVYGDDDEPEEWRVYRESGGVNDREWEIVGAGGTSLDAILNARAALQATAGQGGEHG